MCVRIMLFDLTKSTVNFTPPPPWAETKLRKQKLEQHCDGGTGRAGVHSVGGGKKRSKTITNFWS